MSEKSEATVIGSLPHSRPQRRSDKRAARPGQGSAEPSAQASTKARAGANTKARAGANTKARAAANTKARAGAKAASTKTTPQPATEENATAAREQAIGCPSSLPDGVELIGTLVKAAAELTEIALTVGARALRTAVGRLPRP